MTNGYNKNSFMFKYHKYGQEIADLVTTEIIKRHKLRILKEPYHIAEFGFNNLAVMKAGIKNEIYILRRVFLKFNNRGEGWTQRSI